MLIPSAQADGINFSEYIYLSFKYQNLI